MDHHHERRQTYARSLGDAIAVIPGGVDVTRNDDVDHPFRQSSDFYFLTGFDEPGAVAIIDPAGDDEFVLFVRPRDREMEIWNGYRAGVEGAKRDFGADAAYPISDFGAELRRRLERKSAVHYRMGQRLDSDVLAAMSAGENLSIRYGISSPFAIVDPTPALAEMRLHKTTAEAELLRRAAEISVDGHLAAMKAAEPGKFEYQAQSAMENVFREAGSPRNGYPSIVASGRNACILHYTENDRRMEDGDLLLIDAAAEYGYFSADITRTFPVNGRFSAAQRAIYEVVRAAHQEALSVSELGAPFTGLTDAAVRVVSEGLVDLGLVPGTVDETMEMHHYREFFMHGLGHWLGMDVHDAGFYRKEEKSVALAEGMAFTIEPGVYVDAEQSEVEFVMHPYDFDERHRRRARLGAAKAKEIEAEEEESAQRVAHPVPAEFRGIGVRIEDDILMTAAGAENLTERLPIDIDDVEAACQA